MKVLINSAPRTGSTWLTEIVNRLVKSGGWGGYFPPHIGDKKVIKGHNNNPLDIPEEWKQIIITRNIYDTIVSRILFGRMQWTKYELDEDVPIWQQKFADFIKESSHLSEKEFIDKTFKDHTKIIEVWLENIIMFINFKSPSRILKITYEELRQDTINTVKKICEYLKVEYTEEEIKKILEECSFEVMRSWNDYQGDIDWMYSRRKGIIGDHKNYLNQHQIDFIDSIKNNKINI